MSSAVGLRVQSECNVEHFAVDSTVVQGTLVAVVVYYHCSLTVCAQRCFMVGGCLDVLCLFVWIDGTM